MGDGESIHMALLLQTPSMNLLTRYLSHRNFCPSQAVLTDAQRCLVPHL